MTEIAHLRQRLVHVLPQASIPGTLPEVCDFLWTTQELYLRETETPNGSETDGGTLLTLSMREILDPKVDLEAGRFENTVCLDGNEALLVSLTLLEQTAGSPVDDEGHVLVSDQEVVRVAFFTTDPICSHHGGGFILYRNRCPMGLSSLRGGWCPTSRGGKQRRRTRTIIGFFREDCNVRLS